MTNIDYTVHTLEHSCEVSEKLVTKEVKELEENLLKEGAFVHREIFHGEATLFFQLVSESRILQSILMFLELQTA